MGAPRLVVSRRAAYMLRYAVHTKPDKEVQGFGSIEKDGDDLWITDIIIPEHTVTGSTVDLKPEVLTKFMEELATKGQTLSQWPLWWHSHNTMHAFASGQDKTTLEALSQEYGGVALGLVTNCKGDYFGWYSATIKDDILGSLMVSNTMEVTYEIEEDEELMELVATMMKRVTNKKFPHQNQTGKGYYGAMVKQPDGSMIWMSATEIERSQRKGAEVGSVAVTATNGVPDEELEQEEEAFYHHAQSTYPPFHPAAKMTLTEFIEWFKNDDDPDLPMIQAASAIWMGQ